MSGKDDAEARIRHHVCLSEYRQPGVVHGALDTLTDTQLRVLVLLMQGLGNKEIGGMLGTSEKTISGHKTQIMAKVHASNFVELVKLCIKNGLITL